MDVCGSVGRVLQLPDRLEEGIRFPGAGFTGGCELLVMATENQIWVLCKNSTNS